MTNRRSFLNRALSSSALLAAGDFSFLSRLRPVSAAEAALNPKVVRLDSGIEPWVRLLEDTPRSQVLEEVASRLKKGLGYRETVAALLLAGVRNIQPRPIGFKFHAVLVVNSAHLASLASPDTDRWLPIFWAIDQFKSSQEADVREGDWTLGPVEEKSVPPSHEARQALIEALENWDEPGADAAITSMVRHAGAHEIYEILCRYGARDFREIGHKETYVANSFRVLEAIGWQHAEPVLRSVVYGLLDRVGDKVNPAKADLPADRPFRRNLELVKTIRPDWREGKADTGATLEMLRVIRQGSAKDTSEKAAELMNRGVAAESLFDAFFDGSGELLMRAPGILSLHATTFTNSLHYSFQHCRDEETRKLLLLQNAAFLPLFRGDSADKGLHVDTLEPVTIQSGNAVEDILADVRSQPARAAGKVLAYLKAGGDPQVLGNAARRMIFLKGRDAHDYKFSSAVLEDYQFMAPEWRDRYLAASVFNWRGSADSDNQLVGRIRTALAG